MASESAERDVVTVRLPADLEDWLEARAAALDLDRETVLIQLIASYRAATDLDDPTIDGGPELTVAGPETVRDLLDPAVEEALHGHVGERLDDLDEEFQAKIKDVRERVVQVKREADGKAPADHHHHPEFERIDDVDDRLADLEATLTELDTRLEAAEAAHDEVVSDVETDLTEVRDRLESVAWVVTDLREAYESGGAGPVLDRIKRAAAGADLRRARCERCGEGVEIGLLTEPTCPHCEAALRNVEPASGFFGKPQLLVAGQAETGGEA